jgi:hypothetical protein
MPNIPEYLIRESIPISTGAPLANDFDPAARELMNFGDRMLARAEQFSRQMDTVHAARAVNSFKDEERSFLVESKQRMGMDAEGVTDQGKEFYAKSQEKYGKGLSAGASLLYTAQMASLKDNGIDSLAAHESAQMKAARTDTIEKSFTAIRDDTVAGKYETPDKLEEAVEQHVLLMDTLFPGEGHDAAAAKVRAQSYKLYIEQTAIHSPEMIPGLVARWQGKVDAKDLWEGKNLAEQVMSERNMGAAYESLVTQFGTNHNKMILTAMDPRWGRSNGLTFKAQRQLVESLKADRSNYEHVEDRKETLYRRSQAQVGLDTYLKYYKGELSVDELHRRASRGMIDRETLSGIQSLMKQAKDAEIRGPKIDNPFAVHDAYEMMKRDDPEFESKLKIGMDAGSIKPETAEKLLQQRSDQRFKNAFNYIDDILKPGVFDKYSPDIRVRYGEAMDLLYKELARPENKDRPPLDVAKEVGNRYVGDLTRTIIGLPAPKGFTGDRESVADIQAHRAKLAEEIRNGKISREEADFEAVLLERHLQLARELEDMRKKVQAGGKK